MNKRRLFVLCVSLLLIAGCGKREQRVITIGAVLSETGSGAPYGKDNRRGIELAMEELNAAGGIDGKRLQVIFEDDETQPRVSSAAMTKLVTQDKVKAIIGSTVSSCTLADAPIANREKVVLISPGASSPKITDAGDFVFRNWISDALEGSKMAEYMVNDDRFRSIAILYINNEYGVGLRKVVENRFKQLGGEVPLVDSFDQDATDFRSQLAKIKSANVDALYLAGYYQEMANVLNQAKAMGIKLPIRSCVTFEDPELLKIAGQNAEGVVYSSPYYDLTDTSKVFTVFLSRFTHRFGRDPGIFAAHGYDALNLIAQAIKQRGDDGEGIRDALYNTRDYPGVSGVTTFDSNGDVSKPIAIKVVVNGEFKIKKLMGP
jgi:branched-chain amino acid transport system substrate-binding protein